MEITVTMAQQLKEPLKKSRESIPTLRHKKTRYEQRHEPTRYEQRYEEQKLIALLATNGNVTGINKI